MPGLEGFLISRFMVFTLVLARTGALVMIAPIFSTQSLPRRVRGLIADENFKCRWNLFGGVAFAPERGLFPSPTEFVARYRL